MQTYETVAERDGVKFEVVDSGKVGLFGEPMFYACTFQQVMRPTMSRDTLGTYRTRAEALAKIKEVLSATPHKD